MFKVIQSVLVMGLLLINPLASAQTNQETGVNENIPAAHIASPEMYQVLLENDQVLVLKMVLKPNQADALHRHQDETVYFEKGGKLRIVTGAGKPLEVEVPDGHVMWHSAWSHQVTNIGNTDVVAVIVESKGSNQLISQVSVQP